MLTNRNKGFKLWLTLNNVTINGGIAIKGIKNCSSKSPKNKIF